MSPASLRFGERCCRRSWRAFPIRCTPRTCRSRILRPKSEARPKTRYAHADVFAQGSPLTLCVPRRRSLDRQASTQMRPSMRALGLHLACPRPCTAHLHLCRTPCHPSRRALPEPSRARALQNRRARVPCRTVARACLADQKGVCLRVSANWVVCVVTVLQVKLTQQLQRAKYETAGLAKQLQAEANKSQGLEQNFLRSPALSQSLSKGPAEGKCGTDETWNGKMWRSKRVLRYAAVFESRGYLKVGAIFLVSFSELLACAFPLCPSTLLYGGPLETRNLLRWGGGGGGFQAPGGGGGGALFCCRSGAEETAAHTKQRNSAEWRIAPPRLCSVKQVEHRIVV